MPRDSLSSTPIRLQPPHALPAVDSRAARSAVPLPPERVAEVEDQVSQFMGSLVAEDLRGGGFAACLDSAFAIGRAQVSVATSLAHAGLLQRKFADMEALPAFRAIRALRGQLDAVDPAARPRRLFGLIPPASSPLAYVRRCEGAPARLQEGLGELRAARDALNGELAELEVASTGLWEAMQRLAAAIHFAQVLLERLRLKIEVVKATGAARARSLELEVLRPVQQNLQEMLAQQALCGNCWQALDVLKNTGDDLAGACDVIGRLVAEAADRMQAELGPQTQPAALDALGARFAEVVGAIDALEQYRAAAAGVIAQSAALLQAALAPQGGALLH